MKMVRLPSGREVYRMKRRPGISIIIPTVGNPLLERALAAVRPQLMPRDEVIVVGDTTDGPLLKSEQIVRAAGKQFRWAELAGEAHTFGHDQVNHGLALATGEYIHVSDDDDVHTPTALDYFRRAVDDIHEPTPFLFRFKSYFGPIFWHTRGYFERNHIGGHCLLAPNDSERLGQMAPIYSGDFDFVESTVMAYGGAQHAVWRDEIIAIARPA